MPIRWSPGCKCCGGFPATITGTVVNGCLTSSGMNNASLTVASMDGSSVFGTLHTNSSGAFNGQVTIPSSPLQVRVTAAIDPADPHATRYTTTSATPTLTANQTTAVGTFNLPASTGHHCIAGFAYPLNDTLHLTDGKNGSFTLTWASTNRWQSAALSINYAACPAYGCLAKNNVPCSYVFLTSAGSIQIQFNYRRALATACPDPAGPFTAGVSAIVSPTQDPFNVSQPIPSANEWYCGGSFTWTLTE